MQPHDPNYKPKTTIIPANPDIRCDGQLVVAWVIEDGLVSRPVFAPGATGVPVVPSCHRVVSTDWLKFIHRDLDACQKLIWANLRGCDPAYCEDAQARLAEIDAMLAAGRAFERGADE